MCAQGGLAKEAVCAGSQRSISCEGNCGRSRTRQDEAATSPDDMQLVCAAHHTAGPLDGVEDEEPPSSTIRANMCRICTPIRYRCTPRCVLRISFRLNRFSHTGQIKGFASECDRTCRASVPLYPNRRPQTGQAYGLSPLAWCLRRWAVKLFL